MKNKDLNILIVEDEIIASEYLIHILQSFEYKNIFSASSMQEALKIIKENPIDLVFMDINIDGATDGIECAKILNKEYFLPIIFTTAYADEATLNDASETNIFGYLIKPFEANEVMITLKIALKRIKAITDTLNSLENTNSENNIIILSRAYKYDFITNTFYINNKVVDLTKKELDILDILCANINQNISYETLIEKVWYGKEISNSTIRDTISRMKKKIPDLHLDTIVGFGYILKK